MPKASPSSAQPIPALPHGSATADRGEAPDYRRAPGSISNDRVRGKNPARSAPATLPVEGKRPAKILHDGLSITYRLVDDLRVYGRNSRTHSAKQIARIEASLQAFGWTMPIAIAGDTIVAGHARRQAALNIRERNGSIPRCADISYVPTVDLSALSEAERKAYVIADNKLAEEAGWDNKLLRLELTDLKEMRFDIGLTGFSKPQIDVLLGRSEAAGGRRISDGMRFQVVVDCAGEADQASLLEELRGRGLKAVPIIL